MLTWYTLEIKLQLFAIYIYMEEFKKTTFKMFYFRVKFPQSLSGHPFIDKKYFCIKATFT